MSSGENRAGCADCVGVPSGATFCSSVARYQSIVVSPPRVLSRRRFLSNSSSTRPRSSVTRRTYLERVHALALIVEIIHQIPAFTNRTFVRSRASHRQSFHSFGVEFRSEPPPHSIESIRFDPFRAFVRASRVDASSGVIAIEFVRSFVGTHMSSSSSSSLSSSSSSSDDPRRSSKSLNPQKLSPEPSV